MGERSMILTALEIDGQPVDCQHAVLISGGESEAAPDWVVSILGIRPSDLDRVIACRVIAGIGSQGGRYRGRVRVAAAGPSSFHVRLLGQGPLRELARAS